MATRSHSQSAYSVLLLQKLLSLRDGVSPLTLVLDTPREHSTPLVEEMLLRQKTTAGARSRVVYVCSGLAPRRRSPHVDVYVERRGAASLEALQAQILAEARKAAPDARCLVVIDSLGPMAVSDPLFVAAFVSSLVSPTVSVVGLYRTEGDTPVLPTTPMLAGKPQPLHVLRHLATAVLSVQPLDEAVARKRARDRAEEEPRFGWAEGEGLPFGYSNFRYSKHELFASAVATSGARKDAPDSALHGLETRGLLVDMELRRRSGRAVVERYVLALGSVGSVGSKREQRAEGKMPWQPGAVPCTDICVMADHPLFAVPELDVPVPDDDASDDDLPTSTFNLGLTAKQRRDREGIVLPYFDAQTDIGAGEGGRILYDIGREDDFDEEEDESWEG